MHRIASGLLFLAALAHADLWTHVNVQKIERKPCPIDETSWGTETTGCASMTYMTLDERILPQHERRSSSFEYFNGVARPTVTHWPKGRLADWMVSIQFVSIDPVYGLARTCDRSGYIRVFQNESKADEEAEIVEKTLMIHGQCFVATVLVQASKEICPWCIDESKTTTTSTTTTTEAPIPEVASFWTLPTTSNSTLFAIMILLAVVSFLALVGTVVLLVFYMHDRRKADIFEMPPPQANSTILQKGDCPAYTTRASERWAEYNSETWGSYQPLDIEANFISPKETLVYKVREESDDEYTTTDDSGHDST